MLRRAVSIAFLTGVVVSWGIAQTAGSEKPSLLQDKGLQMGVQIGGLIGDNEQPKELKIIRLDNLAVQLFETFSPRVFLDYGLVSHLRGQVGASFGKIVGRHYSSNVVPLDYRFVYIPFYSRCVDPYVYLGIGGLHYDVSVAASRISPGVAKNGWVGYMPGGIGLVHQVSGHLALDFTLGYNYIFSDDVNGRRGNGHDSFYSGHFGIRFPLAAKTAAEREEEELQRQKAAEEQQRKDAELKAAEEKRLQDLAAQKALEEKLKKEEEARKALEEQRAKEAQKPPEPVAPKVEQPKVELRFEAVYFLVGGSTLSKSEKKKLDVAAKTLLDNPEVKVEISGHTDNTGSRSLNEKLSDARAIAVKNYLVAKGISAERLSTKGFAFDKSAASNTTVEGRRLNRRAEIQAVQ